MEAKQLLSEINNKDLFFQQVYFMLSENQKLKIHAKIELSKLLDEKPDDMQMKEVYITIADKYNIEISSVASMACRL